MSFQSRHLATLTAQLRTRAPGRRFPSVWPRCSSLPVGAPRSQIRWNSTGPSSSSPKISQQWIQCLVASAFVTAGIAGWALGRRNVSSGESPELQVQYATIPEMEQAIGEIRKLLGEDSVSTDNEILRAHGYSEWSTYNIERLPVAVIYPSSTEEVSTIAKICTRYKIPIIPYSGGSSVEGHFSAPHGGFSIDCMNLSSIVEFHPEDMDVVVQPGLSWMELNQKIQSSGLFFPIDPSPSAQLGGMIGTNCSGTNAVRYGTMKDWVINLTIVMSDGTVVKTRRRPRKSSAGYNLNSIFVGSEGTLGVVTEATLKLAPAPTHTGVGVLSFPDIKSAADMAVDVIQKGITVGAIEILDDVQMKVINTIGSTGRSWREQPTLFIKFTGDQESVTHSISRVKAIAGDHGHPVLEFESDEKKQKELWSARKEALWSMLALRKSGSEVWTTDVAVPLSRVAELIELSKTDLDKLGLFGSIIGHVGDGNFHETILFDGAEERMRVEDCVHKMVDRALEMQGTCTGEHGIGMGKIDALQQELGDAPIAVMRAIKQSVDPMWLLNPGKIFHRT